MFRCHRIRRQRENFRLSEHGTIVPRVRRYIGRAAAVPEFYERERKKVEFHQPKP